MQQLKDGLAPSSPHNRILESDPLTQEGSMQNWKKGLADILDWGFLSLISYLPIRQR